MEEKSRNYEVWKDGKLSRHFLKNIRKAVPMAEEQLRVMLRVMVEAQPEVKNFLDLGCGDGALGRVIQSRYPEAQGVFLDLSETMLSDAKELCKENSRKTKFVMEDLNSGSWLESVRKDAPFDAVVSGFAIHHLTDDRKKELYGEIFELLGPGGVFINIEHVSSASDWIESVWNNIFIDSLYDFHTIESPGKSREEVVSSYYSRLDKDANILAPVAEQCGWLKATGFEDVDCYFKLFEVAIFGGRRPR